MTNNLIKSKVELKNILPSKFIIENNELNDKEYIKLPKKNIIELTQVLYWNISKKENEKNSSNTKNQKI